MTYEEAARDIRRMLKYIPPEQMKRVGFLVTEHEFTAIARGLVECHKKIDQPIVVDGGRGWPLDIAALTICGVPVVPWS